MILGLKILASVALVVSFVGIWSENRALMWGGWLGYFVPAEALGFVIGATFSGVVWYLRASPSLFAAAIGTIICTLFAWTVWHFWIEPDVFRHLRGSYKEDAAAGLIVAIASFVTSRWSRMRHRGD